MNIKQLMIFTSALLAGCSSMPDSLQSNNENVVTTYQQAKTLHSGEEVRLGGIIADVAVESDHTQIELVNLPIDDLGKPDIDAEPEGRYFVKIDGFADPVKFSQGRMITFIGNMQVSEKGLVGDYEYQYPVMQAKGYHLWRVEKTATTFGTSLPLTSCKGAFCGGFHSMPTDIKIEERVK